MTEKKHCLCDTPVAFTPNGMNVCEGKLPDGVNILCHHCFRPISFPLENGRTLARPTLKQQDALANYLQQAEAERLRPCFCKAAPKHSDCVAVAGWYRCPQCHGRVSPVPEKHVLPRVELSPLERMAARLDAMEARILALEDKKRK